MTLFANEGDQELDPNKDYFEELVGDGKRYKTPQEIARGKLESDKHIKRLEREMDELRQDLQTRKGMEDLVTNLKKELAPTSPPQGHQPPQDGERTPTGQISDVDLDRLLNDKLSAREAEMYKSRNRAEVVQKLQDSYGPDYIQKLRDFSKTLGVGEKFMDTLAAENPKAFYKLLEIPSGEVRLPNRPAGANLQSDSKSGERTESYYKNLRKTDPKVYHSRESVLERHRQAQKLGEAFFD